MELSDSVCLITGATGGIGREVALSLGREGATLALTGRRNQELSDLAAAIESPTSIHLCDLSDPAATSGLADAALATHGRVDVLINLAGAKVTGPIAALSVDDIQRSLQVNAIAPLRLAGRLGPMMAERGSGVIANVTTVVASGKRNLGAYSGSKAALESMTQSLRQELTAKGVAVFSWDPGWVRTGMSPDGTEEPELAAGRLVEHIRIGKSSRETLS